MIIRGGGATSDLSGFDTYLLAASCAQFPMPIITGIGHERDDTVLDVVANTRVKTPTAAAEFLVNRMMNVIGRLNDLSFQLKTSVVQKLQMETERLNRLIARLPSNVNLSIANESFKVKDLYNRLKLSTNLYLKDQQYLLRSISLEIKSISPYEILKKGYALLSQNGVIISSIKDIEEDSDIIIKMYDGESKAHIEKKTEYE